MTVSKVTQHYETKTREWPGLFIVFEGIDGTGKTSQITRLENFLNQQNFPVLSTYEPSNGPYGTKLRQHFYNRDKISKEEELQLFLDDRKDHLQHTVLPALENGTIVLCDRYFLSTIAYQGATGRFTEEELLTKNNFAPAPDIALLFQAPLSVCLNRITAGRKELLNDFEQHKYLEKTAAIFSCLNFPWLKVVNSNQNIELVEQEIRQLILPLLKTLQQKQRR